jgi:hypothetical protein
MLDPLHIITNRWVGPGVQFVADPFLRKWGEEWTLFFEVLWEDGRKRIAVAESSDLVAWESPSFLLDGAPCSFPYVFRHAGCWWMSPYSDDTPDLLIYRATDSDFPHHWQPWARFRLEKWANDRAVVTLSDRLVVLFGSRVLPWGWTCLKWGSFSIEDKSLDLEGFVKIRSPIRWLANRIWGNPIPTYRLAGDKLTIGSQHYIPLQAYGDCRKYGSQFGLFKLTSSGGCPQVGHPQYFKGHDFLPKWDFTHHVSSQWAGSSLVLAVDGRAAESGWEIGIFRIDGGKL